MHYALSAIFIFGFNQSDLFPPRTVPPIITIPPEHQTLQAGDRLTLECDADGFPSPQIGWLRDGRPLPTTSQRITLEADNTELTVDHIKESDAGECVVAVHVRVSRMYILLSSDFFTEFAQEACVEMECR